MGITNNFRESSKEVASQFNYDRDIEYVGSVKSPFPHNEGENDPEIYSGMIAAASGFARFGYHKDSHSIIMITSKTPVNLRGQRQDDGRILLSQEQLDRCYVPYAYRLKSGRENEREIFARFKQNAQFYFNDVGARANKHFGVFSAGYSMPTPTIFNPDKVEYGEVRLNSAAVYLLKNEADQFKAEFHVSAMRDVGEGGEERFKPFDPHRQSTFMDSHISHISKTVFEGQNRLEVKAKMNRHILQTLSKMWDEHDLYDESGFGFRGVRAKAVNYIYENKKSVLVSAASTTFFFTYGVAVGATSAFLNALGHTIAHGFIHEGVDKSFAARRKIKENLKKKSIEAFSFKENCAAFFQEHTEDNMRRRNPKARKDISGDIEMLTAESLEKMVDHLTLNNSLQLESLRGLMLYAHQRGFPFHRMILDKRSEVEVYASGMILFRHEHPDGKTILFGQYRPEACMGEQFRLPEVYIRQFKDGIVRLEYDRQAENFSSAFQMKEGVPYFEAVNEAQDLLFSPKTHSKGYLSQLDNLVRFKSNRCISSVFRDPDTYKPGHMLPEYMSYEDVHNFFVSPDKFDYTLPDERAATIENSFSEDVDTQSVSI